MKALDKSEREILSEFLDVDYIINTINTIGFYPEQIRQMINDLIDLECEKAFNAARDTKFSDVTDENEEGVIVLTWDDYDLYREELTARE
jgi:hypothetical protein